MQNRTVFITGASSGIGKATAIYFSRNNWNVVASLRNPEKEQELGTMPNVLLVKLDVTDEVSIVLALTQALERFGKIDVLVNNAGYGSLGSFESATTNQITNQFETNVMGLMSVTRTFIPHFRAHNSGVIINIASIAGRTGFPLFSIYNSTKFAVEGFSESLRFELEQFGIRVKIVEPGPIKTDFYSRSMEFFNSESIPEYKEQVQRVSKNIIEWGMQGQDPEVVAKAIFKAATSTNKTLRYPVGGGAPMMMFAKWLLPDCLFRTIIKSTLGIHKK